MLNSCQLNELFKIIYKSVTEGNLPEQPSFLTEQEWIEYLKSTRVCGLFKKVAFSGDRYDNILQNEIRKEYLKLLMLNSRRKQETLSILQKCNEYGIRPVILKGVFLQEFIYPEGEVRPSSDIDLFIQKKEDYEICKKIVEDLGYHKYIYASELWEKVFSKGTTYISNSASNALIFSVDLHHHLFFGSKDKREYVNQAFEDEKLYEECFFGDSQVKVMKREIAFCYLIFHHLKIHSISKFTDFYDLLLLRKNCALNLEVIKDVAKRVNILKETEEVLKEIDLFLKDTKKVELNIIFSKPLDTSFNYKLKCIKGVFYKVLWLYIWFFPSLRFLQSVNPGKKSFLALRLSDWNKKVRDCIKGLLKFKKQERRQL